MVSYHADKILATQGPRHRGTGKGTDRPRDEKFHRDFMDPGRD